MWLLPERKCSVLPCVSFLPRVRESGWENDLAYLYFVNLQRVSCLVTNVCGFLGIICFAFVFHPLHAIRLDMWGHWSTCFYLCPHGNCSLTEKENVTTLWFYTAWNIFLGFASCGRMKKVVGALLHPPNVYIWIYIKMLELIPACFIDKGCMCVPALHSDGQHMPSLNSWTHCLRWSSLSDTWILDSRSHV